MTTEYLIYGALTILVLGGAIGAALQALYRRGFDAGEKASEEGSIKLSAENLATIHWLATKGFRRLVLLGERGPEGFQTKEKAEQAHWALDQLEYYLPKDDWGRTMGSVIR
jgi:hypothetical protein